MTDIRTQKILNAILFFANRGRNKNIGRLKLMKLLWLSDRLHLNKYGRLILKDNYNALPHGPIPSDTMGYSQRSVPGFFNVKGFSIKAEADFDARYFSKSDVEVFETIWDKFGSRGDFELRDLSHDFPEWKRFEKDLADRFMPNSYSMVMEDFFELPTRQVYKDFFTLDTVEEAKSCYNAYNAIQSNLDESCR